MATKKVQHSTGIMNKMRDKTHVILIILVIAFLAWIALDLGMNIFEVDRGANVFAQINGDEIKQTEFESQVDQQIQQMMQQNPNQEIDETQMQQVREQVWTSMVQRKLVYEEIAKMGITVSDNEILDWVYNRPNTLPQVITQNFIDSLGRFDYQRYDAALRDPNNASAWKQIEEMLRESLLFQKWTSSVTNSVIVTEADVLRKYKDDNINADISYLALGINTITDTTLNNVPDDELKKYYDEHKEEFKQEEAVKLSYIMFPETATLEDSALAKRTLEILIKDMKAANVGDSSLIKLVNDNSTSKFSDAYVKPNSLGKKALDFLSGADSGAVSEVIIDDDGYKIIKSLGSKDGTDEFQNASHILVNFGADTVAAKKKADEIAARVRNGEDINELAFQISEDPTAKTNRGSLGWFGKGAMVKEFEDPIIAGKVGDIIGPVKTSYGYHIIKVFGKSKKEFKIAEIKLTIKPGTASKEINRNRAQDFFNQVDKGANFDSTGLKFQLPVQPTGEITEDTPIPGAGANKTLTKFAFDNKVGEIYEPVKITGGYAVYKIVEKIAEGYKNFDSVKTTIIRPRVVLEKKFALLKQKAMEVKSKIQNGDLNSVAALYPDLKVATADSISVGKPNQVLGQDPALYTSILDVPQGSISDPLKGQLGYYIVQMRRVTPFNNDDYLAKAPDIRKQLLQQKQQQSLQSWIAKLQERAEIVDNRSLYYN